MALASESTSTSTWPLPPTQYINHYTDENIRRGRAPKPPLPIHNEYTMFGVPFNADDAIIRPLESQAIRRLYPQNFDHRRELKKLNHSILVNFLDLLDILIKCPDSNKRTDKIEDINILFINMHHLINEFRPHQARETVRVMLEMQKRQRHQLTVLRVLIFRLVAPPLYTYLRQPLHIKIWRINLLPPATFMVAERLERQEDDVRRLVREALASLPDSLDLDSKLLVPSLEELQLRPKSDAGSAAEDKCSSLDRLMCNIVDAL